jgi:hypothetical protein
MGVIFKKPARRKSGFFFFTAPYAVEVFKKQAGGIRNENIGTLVDDQTFYDTKILSSNQMKKLWFEI